MWKLSSIAAVVVLMAGPLPASAEPGAVRDRSEAPGTHALLDVPYMAQPPELCGGAAVAMVLRYWGGRDVFPQDFAPLVSASDGGILTGTLASAVRGRGWQALEVPAGNDAAHARVRSEIDQGRPLIALIEVGPRTYHYVVIVGSTDREVVLHDPARAPFRVLRWTEFDRAWAAAGRWMLLILPTSVPHPGDDQTHAGPLPVSPARGVARAPCAALVDHGVERSLAGESEDAEREFHAAIALCPTSAEARAELAGLRFSQSRWMEARDLALSATRLAPDDAYAWQLVATSRYLLGDSQGALAAWNRIGEPRIDAVDMHGADRTRQPVLVRAAGWQPRQVLTPEAFGLALRRLRDLPVVSTARVRYDTAEAGLARLNVFIEERPLVPTGRIPLATMGARALILHELHLDVAGWLGAAEMQSVLWRWSAERPRVAVGLSLPSPGWLPGIVSVEGSWERQTYAGTPSSDDPTRVREERRRAGVHVADWSTSWLRWQGGVALDRWRTPHVSGRSRDDLAVEGAVELRAAGDRVALSVSGGVWNPSSTDRFSSGSLLAAWRSNDDSTTPFWSATVGLDAASLTAPLALWPGAGTGTGRPGLLRAHPLLNEGVLSGPVFGRDVARGTVEYARPLARTLAGRLAVAGFVDAAQAWSRTDNRGHSPLYVDAGAGLRVSGAGAGGTIRVDVARGLRDGRTVLSAGWGGAWPR